jgi:hypothetical protein
LEHNGCGFDDFLLCVLAERVHLPHKLVLKLLRLLNVLFPFVLTSSLKFLV